MFVTFLTFTERRAEAPRFMAEHNGWIAQGFADGVFLCVGSLDDGVGGAIVSNEASRAAHDARLSADPFVVHGIVTAETHAIDVKRAIPALDHVKASA
jgi:uncharacterized protein YciI